MDLDQLNAFCQLAEHKNYRQASDHLCITQSALTKKIQRLEESIGSQLFERGRQGAKLTLAGETLLPDAKKLVDSFQQFKGLSKVVSEGSRGHLRIGFGISTYNEAPGYVAAFKQQYPEVKITLNDIPSQTQYQQLESGDLHLSFNRLPAESAFKTFRLYSDQLVIAIHEQEEVDENDVWTTLSKLHYLQLNPSRGPGLNTQIHQYLYSHDQHLMAEQQADDILTLLALVSARLGYTIIPASTQKIRRSRIRYIPLSGEYACWDVGLIWNNRSPNPLLKRFVEFVTGK